MLHGRTIEDLQENLGGWSLQDFTPGLIYVSRAKRMDLLPEKFRVYRCGT